MYHTVQPVSIATPEIKLNLLGLETDSVPLPEVDMYIIIMSVLLRLRTYTREFALWLFSASLYKIISQTPSTVTIVIVECVSNDCPCWCA